MKRQLITIISTILLFLTSVLFPNFLQAEEITDNDFEFSLDVPEGYKVVGYTPDGMSYQFRHDRLPVDFVLRIYSSESYKNTKEALSGALTKLSANYDGIDTFLWSDTFCSITIFDTKVTSEKGSTGWAIAVSLPEKESFLVLLSYADSDKAKDCEQFIISTLNSLTIGKESSLIPGPITTYAFPKTKTKQILLDIAGSRIETSIDEDDSEANQFVIDCEFAVLKLYANNQKWKEAWTRYYKAIYRDSYSRLDQVAFDIKQTLLPTAKKRTPQNPNIAINETLLNWVQNFEYTRAIGSKNTDFTNVIDEITGSGSDCDSRSMLMCILMEQLGTKSCLFISRAYSHAVYGVAFDIPGAKIAVENTYFLLNETTAKGINPGLIASEHRETEKWIPVILP